jgi:MFS family permease
MLFLFSSYSGRMAGRIGPRLPMSVGPLVAAAGMALLMRATPGESYATTVLPGALIFGLGLVLIVPALTSTALGALSQERAGIASAINNDIARVGSLSAVALIPAIAGISTATTGVNAALFTNGFRTGIAISAVLCALGGVVAFLTVRNRPAREASAQAMPLGPVRCEPATARSGGGS